MTTPIRIREAAGTWSVRSGGAVLGESKNALELSEGDHEPVIYFPREDIATALLDESDKRYQCEHKGEATYYSIVNMSTTTPDAVWSYENPNAVAEQIKGYLAFQQSDSVKVEQI